MSAVTLAKEPDDGRLLVRPTTLRRRRPVLSFVGVITLVALALFALGRSGVAFPTADLQHTYSLGDGSASHAPAYSLVNHGFRPIEVVAVRSSGTVLVADPGVELRLTGSPTLPDLPAFAPFTVPVGGHRNLVLDLTRCPDGLGFGPVRLEVVVRSVDLGLRRTLVVPEEPGLC